MRWWAGGCAIAAVTVLAACGTTGGGGSAAGGSSGSTPTGPPSGTPTHTSAPPSPSAPSVTPSPPAAGCAAGRTEVAVAPGDPVQRPLCVRPATVVSLVLRPRSDDRRWTGVRSSAPVFVLVSGWRLDADGTAHATLRAAGARGGSARITALAKAPDIAGAAKAAFTLNVNVVPYPREG
ncbi:hypothetical protein [Streptomyces sp. NPDC050121]|uniref:hypothetical protein n=1 Tax=Streptomyces sp. NPDC050121 TaxID=3365601 RepID=UPI0037AB19F3